MASEIIDIKNYNSKTNDVYFFDSNIWMFLFCPIANVNQPHQKVYSGFLSTVKSLGATIFISSLILSEFANRYLRLDFEQWKKETSNYSAKFKKDYVSTQRYTDTAKEIKVQIRKILQLCEKHPDDFNSINLDNVLNYFEKIDFNDSYYAEFLKNKNWILVTDESDFELISAPIRVLTIL